MSTRKAPVAQPEQGAAAPDVVQQLLAERRELKVANERLRLEVEEARAAAQARIAEAKPDRRLTALEEENRRLRKELASLSAENEYLLEGVALAVEGLEKAAAEDGTPAASGTSAAPA
jgi:predicted RNase H-like nuclease (RuvC/YqgF family)